MKMEMDGKEPLVLLFGLPLLTSGIVVGAMYLGQRWTVVVPPPPIQVQAPAFSPQVTAVLPDGAIQVNNHVPPAQIHEVVREIVKVPDVYVENRVEPSRPPDVVVTLPPPERAAPPKGEVVPQSASLEAPPAKPAPKPETPPASVPPAAPKEAAHPEGDLLPPPADARNKANQPPALTPGK